MSKHTPGPWAVVHTTAGTLIKSTVQPGYFAKLEGACAAAYGKEGEANARLIAAAPDYKAVTDFLLSRWERMTRYLSVAEISELEALKCAAIAKAEGR